MNWKISSRPGSADSLGVGLPLHQHAVACMKITYAKIVRCVRMKGRLACNNSTGAAEEASRASFSEMICNSSCYGCAIV